MNSKKTEVLPYNPEWPKIFEHESGKIRDLLNNSCATIHHIGSTSVPELAAKKDIDVLLIIDKLNSSLLLKKLGYIFKGEANIPLRYFFSKNTEYSKVNLHVCEPDHGFIELNLTFRDYLRKHEEDAKKYETLKYKILQSPEANQKIQGMLTIYTIKKDDFIKSILKKAGYDGFTINFCIHDREWDEYHRIKKDRLGDLTRFSEPDLFNGLDNPYHFCLYKGIEIVAIADIEGSDTVIYVDKPCQNQNIEEYLSSFIEKWIMQKGSKGVRS